MWCLGRDCQRQIGTFARIHAVEQLCHRKRGDLAIAGAWLAHHGINKMSDRCSRWDFAIALGVNNFGDEVTQCNALTALDV